MPSNAIGSPSVTVPAVPWNTAKPPCQGALTPPSGAVQLVAALFQVALPPSTMPLPTVSAPSQNCRPKPPVLTIRLTWPGVAVEISMSLGDEPRRQAADQEAVVGQRAAIVDQPVDAAAEAAGIGDVERAVERERAGDDDQVVDPAADDVGQAELVIEQRSGAQHQRADGQRAGARARREMAAVGDGHRAADAARAAQPRAARHVGGPEDRAVDQQPSALDAWFRPNRCERRQRSACRFPSGPRSRRR